MDKHIIDMEGCLQRGALHEALAERIVADYHATEEFSAARGSPPLTRAKTFVAAAQAFLGVEEDPR
jgi:hypothetical protein